MKLHDTGVYLVNGVPQTSAPAGVTEADAKKGTIAYGILKAHNTGDSMQDLRMKFDSMTSHDITYVGIIQTARASGMTEFPLPYVMTNCHNSLCAVGGTINEDDHQFALSAAHKYGGIYVPPNMAVIHSYNREMMSGCGRMILGSDSHTRYGALGTMAVGEGGGELAKQLVGRTYDMSYPGVVAIYLTGKPAPGVGPHDVALALVAATYANGYVKNKVMEFVGPGVANLSADYRNGIDVMTTETTCWSSIWQTDDTTKEYFVQHGRPEAYKELKPADVAYYDGCIELDLSTVECMIALPMHPSYAYPIRELKANAKEILQAAQDQANRQLGGKVEMDLVGKICDDGRIYVDQGVVAGCSGGTYENICAVADIIKGKSCGNGEFKFSVYPDSMPTYLELVKNGAVADIVSAGGIFRECFCGPCFGAGDTPANGEFSIRHTTRNFPNREGSKPGEGQISAVALMDARSIAATAANGGYLTAASELTDVEYTVPDYHFEQGVYDKRVYNGWGKAEPDAELRFGPNKGQKVPLELADLPYVQVASQGMSEVKLLGLAAVFVYAFFTFSWCMRQYNFAAVLVGAAPMVAERTASEQERKVFTDRTARVISLAAHQFNQGLRAYYFGLSMLAWFIHPGFFVLATTGVVLVLYRRDFRSKTLDAMRI